MNKKDRKLVKSIDHRVDLVGDAIRQNCSALSKRLDSIHKNIESLANEIKRVYGPRPYRGKRR